MYIPPSYAEPRAEVVFDFIEAHPFATLVTAGVDGLFATHLPLVLHRDEGEHGTLRGHIARANAHHRQELANPEALVIFSGADAYVSPSLYPSKAEHGKVVPTWNYAAVHAYGPIRFVHDPALLRPHLEALTRQHEAGREHPWAVDDAPAEYIAQHSRAIVGVEIPIARVEGKWKMSQNRPSGDIDGVVRALAASGNETERRVGEMVQARRPAGR